jgi:hypothetical protein
VSSVLGLGSTTVTAAVTCNAARTSCTWSAGLPSLPGLYTVKAIVSDRAGNVYTGPASSLRVIV